MHGHPNVKLSIYVVYVPIMFPAKDRVKINLLTAICGRYILVSERKLE